MRISVYAPRRTNTAPIYISRHALATHRVLRLLTHLLLLRNRNPIEHREHARRTDRGGKSDRHAHPPHSLVRSLLLQGRHTRPPGCRELSDTPPTRLQRRGNVPELHHQRHVEGPLKRRQHRRDAPVELPVQRQLERRRDEQLRRREPRVEASDRFIEIGARDGVEIEDVVTGGRQHTGRDVNDQNDLHVVENEGYGVVVEGRQRDGEGVPQGFHRTLHAFYSKWDTSDPNLPRHRNWDSAP